MPDSLPSILPGNAYLPPDYPSGQSINIGGVRWFEYQGYALVDATTGNVIALRNEKDQPCAIPCPNDPIPLSANDPAYLTHASFYIPKVGEAQAYNVKTITSSVTSGSTGSTDVLKLATSAADDMTVTTTPGACSGAATNGVLPSGVTAGEAIGIFAPLPGIAIAAPIELKLYSSTSADGSGTAGSNIRANQGRILIPCRITYYRKLRSPNLSIGISTNQREQFDKLS